MMTSYASTSAVAKGGLPPPGARPAGICIARSELCRGLARDVRPLSYLTRASTTRAGYKVLGTYVLDTGACRRLTGCRLIELVQSAQADPAGRSRSDHASLGIGYVLRGPARVLAEESKGADPRMQQRSVERGLGGRQKLVASDSMTRSGRGDELVMTSMQDDCRGIAGLGPECAIVAPSGARRISNARMQPGLRRLHRKSHPNLVRRLVRDRLRHRVVMAACRDRRPGRLSRPASHADRASQP